MVGGLMLPRASKSKRLADEIAAASGHRFSPPWLSFVVRSVLDTTCWLVLMR
jgi:hypothetical protein